VATIEDAMSIDAMTIVAEADEVAEASEEYTARAALYRLFAAAFVEEPRPEFLERLRSPQALEALARMGAHFDADFTAAPLAALADAIACEYTTLFATPGGCTPVESARLTGRVQQEPFHRVHADYQRAGFEVVPGRFSVFDDHLGVELSFVAALLERAAAAHASSDTQAAAALDKAIKRFWVQHLGLWVRGYCALVERATMHSFFREMARLLRAFAEQELAAMQLRVDDLDGGKAVVPKSEIAVLFDPDEPECKACDGNPARREARSEPRTEPQWQPLERVR
jgi:TorA maturation chaperone TorD